MVVSTIADGPVIIYGLVDPRSRQLRYVGRTTPKLHRERFRFHLRQASKGIKTKCHRWLRGLLLAGLQPEFIIIETTVEECWIEAEQFWIAYFRFIGCNLTNLTSGGDGLTGMKHSAEAVAKTRAAHLGQKRSLEARSLMRAAWTEERRKKQSETARRRGFPPGATEAAHLARRGQPLTAAHKARLSEFFSGKTLSDDHKRKVSAGISRSWTRERREAQSKKMSSWRRSVPLKTHCIRGHALSGENLYLKPNGDRCCRACHRDEERRRKRKQRFLDAEIKQP